MTDIIVNIKDEVMTPAGAVTSFSLINESGALVELSTLGAGITSIVVPDNAGQPTDVVLGYKNLADYLNDSPCAGKTPGRFANRIAGGRLPIDGRIYQLTQNDGTNSLHGGPEGFHNRIWTPEIIPGRGVKMTYFSPDGEEGYPGNLRISVSYLWDNTNTLTIVYEAISDKPTIVNPTNHAYFNLDGIKSRSCLDHLLKLSCRNRIQSDFNDIPTGVILPVGGTPFDFLTPKSLGKDINADFENIRHGKGYNHYFLIDGFEGKEAMAKGEEKKDDLSIHEGAVLRSEKSGITLKVSTTLPGLMLYTGNWLYGSPVGKGGFSYPDHAGVAIECQFPPDAPNQLGFPAPWLRPGEIYRHIIRYELSAGD